MQPLILASSSLSRQKLLQQLQLDFAVISPDIDETPHPNESARALVERLAIEKAQKVAQFKPDALIIAADEVAVLNNNVCSKPANYQEAINYLQAASGQKINFSTGYCVLNASENHYQSGIESYQVQFRQLSLAMIERYLAKESPYDCAASFKIEGLGVALCDQLIGNDISALIGLPLIAIVRCLEKEGINIL